EDRARQYRLQYAPPPLPRKIERERIAIQRETTPNPLKTQTGRHRKNRQSNRQNSEITGQAHQSRVLRSLQLSQIGMAQLIACLMPWLTLRKRKETKAIVVHRAFCWQSLSTLARFPNKNRQINTASSMHAYPVIPVCLAHLHNGLAGY
ncbi:hypothetical protein NKW56_15850, partial [Acetobacter cerevisiae]|nr:hypothetical protein [Acetobacter cerevisiae]MCP1280009.1 hypothetical protein [Acetobacter cerevisiae]